MFFAPEVITRKNLYDADLKVYESRGLVFRHTDNIAQWVKAMKHVKFPEVSYAWLERTIRLLLFA